MGRDDLIPEIIGDPKLLMAKLSSVMSGRLLTYQDRGITIAGDPDGRCKATIYFWGVEGFSVEILSDLSVLINDQEVESGDDLTAEKINEGLMDRLARVARIKT